MDVEPLSPAKVLHIASNLREWDRREVFANLWSDDPVELAERVLYCGDFSWICSNGGDPIAALGALPVSPHVWSVWMFATDDFRQIGLPLTRFAKRTMMPALLKSGAHRAECRSMEGHDEAHAWLEMLGACREARHPMAGKNRETFYTYAWTLE